MADDIQLTIRGLDPATKAALTRRAHDEGVSLNRYLVGSLKRSAGTDAASVRLQALKQFVKRHPIASADQKALADALADADRLSIRKQARDDAGL